jgi:hypothetical protein
VRGVRTTLSELFVCSFLLALMPRRCDFILLFSIVESVSKRKRAFVIGCVRPFLIFIIIHFIFYFYIIIIENSLFRFLRVLL